MPLLIRQLSSTTAEIPLVDVPLNDYPNDLNATTQAYLNEAHRIELTDPKFTFESPLPLSGRCYIGRAGPIIRFFRTLFSCTSHNTNGQKPT
jgi:hypothetical protein